VSREPEDITRQNTFLTAEWQNLLMLNYEVDPGLLSPRVPAGTELDGFDGRTFIRLIGFEFNNTRILGVPIPFHRSFIEVNLRFYIRRGTKRGVAFIRELVPSQAVASIARRAFNENYSCVPMSHKVRASIDGSSMHAEYAWGAAGRRCLMNGEMIGAPSLPEEGSLAQFITEHYWGYAAQSGGGCLEYQVEHPRWRVWQASDAGFKGDSSSFYGPEFSSVLERKPDSAFLADGSAVTVSKGTRVA
jgi:uncharacterized protein YqjF (DUF2071 family)